MDLRSATPGLLLLFLVLCVVVVRPAGAWSLTLVHSQDSYGSVVAVDGANNPCTPVGLSYVGGEGQAGCLGGNARREAVIAQLRSNTSMNLMVVDIGNVFSGGQYFLFSYDTVLKYTLKIGYDIIKLDLYDMLVGMDRFTRFIPQFTGNNTRIVSSNLVGLQDDPATAALDIQAQTVISYADGEKVGFAGTMPVNMQALAEDLGTMDSTDEVDALQVAVAILQNQGVNKVVVAVSNIQFVDPLLQRVSGIDVVLVQRQYYANNNDSGIAVGPYPVVKQMKWNQVVCVAGVGVWGAHLGQLDLEFDQYGVIQSCSGNAIPLSDAITPNATVQNEVIADYNMSLAGMKRVIGHASVTLDLNNKCWFGECGLGSWAADQFLAAGKTDLAFINGGALARAIAAGNITVQDYTRAFPYPADAITTFGLRGKHLLLALEHSVSLANETSYDISQGVGRFLQISGVKFTWNPKEEVGMRIVNAWVRVANTLKVPTDPALAAKRQDEPYRTTKQWELVDPERVYTATTISFLSSGLDGYVALGDNALDLQITGLTAESVILDGLSSGSVTLTETGRIVASTATRRTCVPPDGTLPCNGNGVCLAGVCQCTTPDTSGDYCTVQASSGSDSTLAIVLGVILPITLLLVVLAILFAVLLLGYMRYKRPKVILKEPNYQLLVWRRDSMESNEGMKMLPMRRLNPQVQSVLIEFLMDKHVVQAVGSVAHANPSSIDEVAAAMVLVHQSADKGTELIRLLLKNELLSQDDEQVLFREETPGVKAFSVFSRMVGLPFLWHTFAYPIAELEIANNVDAKSPRSNVTDSDPAPFGSIFSLATAVEINPKMMEEGQDNFVGRLQLELLVQKLFTRILDSLPQFPLYMRQLCRMLYEDMRYDHPDYIHRVLGNLIFLRFICPALLVPQTYGLVKEQTHPQTHRTLILITKVLQNLASKNEFSDKEVFMEAMNGFITRNVCKLEAFFDHLCAPTDDPTFGDPPTSIVPRQFKRKALTVMHQFVQAHAKEIHDELQEFPAYAVQGSLERLKYLAQDRENENDGSTSDSEESEDEVPNTQKP